jgi:hypothetical protein
MNLSISLGEALTAAALLASGATAWATLRTSFRATKADHDRRLTAVEADVAELKESQVTVALLQQTVQNFEATANGIVQESRATRQTMETMGKSLVRIETQLAMEGRPVPGGR